MQSYYYRPIPHVLFCLVFGFGFVSKADFEIYLKDTNRIPLYAQQTSYWCGAGAGQMTLEGFPDDVNYSYAQKAVWDEIQKYKVEQGWYADPDGLKGALAQLGKDSHWEATCAKTRDAITRLTIDGMYMGKFPVPVLVYGHAHWVVVIGATLEEHPMMSMVLKLKTIEAHDPWEAQHVLVSGEAWLKKFWNETGGSGKWGNCYVAVHEVEARKKSLLAGMKIVTEKQPTDGSAISPDLALTKAKAYLTQITKERPAFKDLSDGFLFDPMLVTHENGNYYLVPVGKKKNGESLGAVMVNAYSGAWEGLSLFQKPLRYRKQKQQGQWVFYPSEESRSPFHPVYQTAKSYVDLDGKVSSELHELGRGN